MRKNPKFLALLSSGLIIGTALGATACMVNAEEKSYLGVDNVTATSVLPASSYGDYDPWNLLDGDLSTAWVENVSGNGEGETITFELPAGSVVTGVEIMNGYCKSEDIFYKNSAPKTIICRVSGKQCTIDLSDTVNDYNAACAGYIRTLPSQIDANAISFEIKDVRPGSKYTDTCISEIHLLGYNFFDTEEGNIWAGALDHTIHPEDLSEAEVYTLLSMAEQVYKRYTSDEYMDDFVLFNESADSDLRAFLLYWYQYHCSIDRRIQSWDEFHEISRMDLEEMLTELWGFCGEEDIETFREQYVVEIDSDRYSMSATGDFGAAGNVVFLNPAAYYEEDTLVIEGDVCVYDWDTSTHIPTCRFSAVFDREKANESGIHTFRELAVYEEGKEPGFPMEEDPDYSQENDIHTTDQGYSEPALYSEEELCTMALDYYERHYNGYRPSFCDVERNDNAGILLHLYDDLGDHVATCAWYEVDARGIGYDYIMGDPVDFNN